LGLGVVVCVVTVQKIEWLQAARSWLRIGSFNSQDKILATISVLVSSAGLLGWYLLSTPNLSDIVDMFVPKAPLGILLIGAFLFSMVNAAVEECVYRGALLPALDNVLGQGLASLLLQAIAFGALHIHGFPRGTVGVLLATIYGVMMGIIRRKSGGVLAPWVAHVLTDLVIVAVVLTIARTGVALSVVVE
jgi:hypothetical protein